jgi:hypothetical protein
MRPCALKNKIQRILLRNWSIMEFSLNLIKMITPLSQSHLKKTRTAIIFSEDYRQLNKRMNYKGSRQRQREINYVVWLTKKKEHMFVKKKLVGNVIMIAIAQVWELAQLLNVVLVLIPFLFNKLSALHQKDHQEHVMEELKTNPIHILSWKITIVLMIVNVMEGVHAQY